MADAIAAEPRGFARTVVPRDGARAAIAAAASRPEAELVAALAPDATLPPALEPRTEALARRLIENLRRRRADPVTAAIRAFPMSSPSGLALMSLAEAYLRIPDRPTRDALLVDRLRASDWANPGTGRAAGALAGALRLSRAALAPREGWSAALPALARPVLRRAFDLAMRRLGDQFVAGRSIDEALRRGRARERRGFGHSYDMLGEAAVSDAQAQFHYALYRGALHAIGRVRPNAPLRDRPGLSIKLSALHPRYLRAHRATVIDELYPQLLRLAHLARERGVGLNIDAEEAERLDLSLDLLELLCREPDLAGWDGIGFVVQAYQTRAPAVIDHLAALAGDTGRRLMLRLVKGAYWDTEIKRAQELGLAHFPVWTRKLHADIAYAACARRILAAPDRFYGQFATHNARTIATVAMLADELAVPKNGLEFQCLHGMGEPIHRLAMRATGIRSRIYAPVGDHERLLSYLVRRLLENGANSSFVNRIADPAHPPASLAADPVAEAARTEPPFAPDPRVTPPAFVYGAHRRNSRGLDLADEATLADLLGHALPGAAREPVQAGPPGPAASPVRAVANPADPGEIVGHVAECGPAEIEAAQARAASATGPLRSVPVATRAAILRRAADLVERDHPVLIATIVREAGRTVAAALAEIREAVDFLLYYAAEAEANLTARDEPLGVVVCISPWNFPLAIFVGQVAAALAAGNAVLAKPAEQTPLTAALAVRLLHEAGVPPNALQLLPGDGAVGAALVARGPCDGVMFTGSDLAARHISAALAQRAPARPIPLVAETGGLNAMFADSSALAETLVRDVLHSAFDSAGQRCSSLRILCLADADADRVVDLLCGAMERITLGDPSDLATEMGPLIDDEAAARVRAHLDAMVRRGYRVLRPSWADRAASLGPRFVAPAIVEIDAIDDVEGEVFGPVLHVLRVRPGGFDAVLATLAARRYGLTFGVQSRIAAVIDRLQRAAPAGNVYVNRNMIGAVVGLQPFGGHGRSGTGPKAGGPWLLRRLSHPAGPPPGRGHAPADPALARYLAHLDGIDPSAAGEVRAATNGIAFGPASMVELPGPTGESDLLLLEPRGEVLCLATDPHERRIQVGIAIATGNRATVLGEPREAGDWIGFARVVTAVGQAGPEAVLYAGDPAALADLVRRLDDHMQAVVPIHVRGPAGHYPVEWLLRERAISVDTSSACGNAALMSLV